MTIKVESQGDNIFKALTELAPMLKIEFSKNNGDFILTFENNHEDGFSVTKNASNLHISYSTDISFFRGLLVLLADKEKSFFKEQKCAFNSFAVMLDLSRNAVVNQDFLFEFIRHCALLGYNEIQLYTEDTYEIPNNEYFGYMRGRLTANEIKKADLYCKLFGIELVPCIQTLAHLSQITRYEDYKDIIDCNDILLIGEDKTYELIDDMFKALSNSYTSRKVNIGMDEAHMVGRGKYLDKHGYEKSHIIMQEHLNKVVDIAKKYGFNVSMWSDMFFKSAYGEYKPTKNTENAKLLQINKEVDLIYWDYYHTEYEHYNQMLKLHKLLTNKVSFAGGAWKWVGFTPWNFFSIKTAELAINACKENNIKNFTVTCWGDNGAECAFMSILPSLYFNAELAYNQKSTDYEKFKTLTGLSFKEFMNIDTAVRFNDLDTDCNNSSKFFLYNDPLLDTYNTLVPDNSEEFYKNKIKNLKAVCKKSHTYNYIFQTQIRLCQVLEYKCSLGSKIRKYYSAGDKKALQEISQVIIPKTIQRMHRFIKAFNNQWLRENKTFGLEIQQARLGGVIERLKFTASYLNDYINGNKKTLDILEEKPLPLSKNQDLNTHFFYSWGGIMTTSVI